MINRTVASPARSYLRVFRDGHEPTTRKKDAILKRAAAVEEIANAFRMLSSVMILTSALTEESAEGYALSLIGYSSYTIKKMMFDHLKGRTPSKDKRFLPPAPELASYCDKIEEKMNQAAHTIRRYAGLQTYSQALKETR